MEVYSFALDYPINCTVEFNPKSKRTEGDIALKSSDGYRIFISWGPMEKVAKFKDAAAHADYSLGKVGKSGEAKINDVRKEFRRVNGHQAAFSHIRLELIKRGIFFNKTRTPQEVRSLHVHCPDSSRYFVLYCPGNLNQSVQQGEVLTKMIGSFTCH